MTTHGPHGAAPTGAAPRPFISPQHARHSTARPDIGAIDSDEHPPKAKNEP
jgi:hypothetical protein